MQMPIFLNSEEIAETVKIGVREIRRYVAEHGLPAFQDRPGCRLKARRESL